MRIAILSDLHTVQDGDYESESHLNMSVNAALVTQHPISGLKKLIAEEALIADLILCPGDITHKAEEVPLSYAWRELHELKDSFQASELIATVGNHDLDSRYITSDYDAKGRALALDPLFPVNDWDNSNHFWARNYLLHSSDNYQVLVVNSCAYHGGSDVEIEYGRISPHTLAAIKDELENANNDDVVRIALVHHHPHKLDEIKDPDYEVMKSGSELIRLLGSGEYGRWLIVHGHKHLPHIAYGAGGNTAPVILSAGSFSVVLGKGRTRVRNQFYYLNVCLTDGQLFGTGRAWDWVPTVGWQISGRSSGIPAMFGFGCRDDPKVLAEQVETVLGSESHMKWEDIVSEIAALQHLLPSDALTLKKELKNKNINILVDEVTSAPAQVGRAPE